MKFVTLISNVSGVNWVELAFLYFISYFMEIYFCRPANLLGGACHEYM